MSENEYVPLPPDEEQKYRDAIGRSFVAHLGGPKGLVSHPVLRGPDFMCIGAQKAATTWLQHNMGFHPHIFVPCVKELFYFSQVHFRNFADANRLRQAEIDYVGTHFSKKYEEEEPDRARELAHLRAFELTDEWYMKEFSFARNYQVTLEVDPTTGLVPFSGVRHALHLNPSAKFIVILRDPADRALSHLRMDLRDSAPEAFDERLANFPFDMAYYYSDYPSWLGRWRALVSPERFLFIRYADIQDEPREVLKRVCWFMGVEYNAEYFPRAEVPRHQGAPSAAHEELYAKVRAAMDPIYDRMHELPVQP